MKKTIGVVKTFKIVKRSCSLNRYYRVNNHLGHTNNIFHLSSGFCSLNTKIRIIFSKILQYKDYVSNLKSRPYLIIGNWFWIQWCPKSKVWAKGPTFICFFHGLRTPGEEIAFTARPKIHSYSQIFRYGRSTFCLPHRHKFSYFFELCLHWVSVVRALDYLIIPQYGISIQGWLFFPI